MAITDAPLVRAQRRSAAATGVRSRLSGSPWRHLDISLIVVLGLLSVVSVVMVLAATHGPRTTTNDTFFMVRQAMFVVIGFGVMFGVAMIDYRRWREWWVGVYALGMLSLVFVMLFGISAKGTQRGFAIAGFQLQPSEFMKIAAVIVLAALFADRAPDLRGTLTGLGVVAPPVVLILLQPDLGTALVFGAITLGVLLVAGVPARVMLGLLLAASLATGVVLTSDVLAEYQKARLTNFVNPDALDRDARYNTEQSQIAIASGGLTGQGLLKGGQTSNGYVPEQQTDFIFTAIGEELGFVGAASVLALYGFLLWRILRAAQLSRDAFGTLLCVGVFCMILFQLFENIGMSLGIMPVTGIPLPFMSYGGSSMLVAFILAGFVLNVHMRRFS
ncbi:rod shape-determining protein RodA [Actinomarinicola tropica]|uniref:Peptidoglycan glycosyltransferase RodA n=1 Tax=Actinomarinicola tropica TaxID=2789776 RepID=A0A5Q2RR87_9ACTN|nr:rod shape-determining protein RodA [Actinomarinicola tropica]QGG95705.1 rod shape-determining protein RodA [Actinomarinicola tropica]